MAGTFRDDPELISKHARAMPGASSLGYLHQLLAMTGWRGSYQMPDCR
jgi:hypothetical protein